MSTLLSVSDAAQLLNVSVQRVRELCRTETITAQKVGNSWIIERDSVTKYGLKTAHVLAEDHATYRSTSKKPIALSFFSGAMGLDLGLEKAGFDVVLTCESDKYCRQTIALNRPDVAMLGDINNCSAQEVLETAGLNSHSCVDVIAGGPPCQAFSTAGNRKGLSDERGNVFLKYVELCLEIQPEYFVIENVRGLLSCPMLHRPHNKRGSDFPPLSQDELKGGALSFILKMIEASGYSYSFNLYNSANFGAPQVRERVIIICAKDGRKPPYLVPTHSETGEHGLPKWKTLRSCLKNIDKHDHLNFPAKRIEYYKLLKPGQNWRNLPRELQEQAMGASYHSGGGKTGFYRRLAWDKPSPTLVTHPAMPATDLAHPIENRPLSVQEYMRIQQFPDDWILAGPLVQQYKQIGNAVPCGLGQAIGSLLMKLRRDEEISVNSGFKYSRYSNTDEISWTESFTRSLRRRSEQLEIAL